MAQLPDRADIVVIGAGVVGNAAVSHLADLGWRSIVQIDKGPLPDPGGSTGHASNFVFPVDHSKEITDLTVDSLRQYDELGVLSLCGGIEVARSPERMQELTRRMTSARAWGVEAHLISPAEIQQLVPYCDARLLLGGFHTPTGAIVDPIRAGELMRERAESVGALTTCAETEVLDLEVEHGRIRRVVTDAGRIEAETVIIACGVWSPRIAALAGAAIPLTPAVHQMIDVGPIPQLEQTDQWISFPLLRDMDSLMYERQRGPDLEIGSYAHRPLLHHPDEIPPVGDHPGQATPTSFPFTEDDFTLQMQQAQQMFPELLTDPEPPRTAALNGLLSLTPDGGALIGETPEVAGLWSAAAVWIKEAAGVGRMLAELITDGTSEIDPHGSDIARFAPAQRTSSHVLSRAAEGFPKIYGITHPREQWLSDRPLRTSPFHPRTEVLGARYFEAAGWERPQWYEANADLLQEYGDQVDRRTAEWDRRWWSPIIEAEHRAMRDRVAMVDLGAFAIFDIHGPGAVDYLEQLAVARIDVRVGRVVYTPLLTPAGTFRSDLTIVRRGEEDFRVITGGAEGARDLTWFRGHLPADGSVQLTDATSAVTTLGLWGPRARDLLERVTEHDLASEAFGFGTAQDVQIGSVPASLLRISYVGELGWEIHLPVEHGLRVWDLLWGSGQDLGLVAAGIGVYGTTGRLEKGYRLMGAELNAEYDPVEADLALPKVKTHDFVGKQAYLAARAADPAALLCTVALDPVADDTEPRCPTGGEPVLTPDGEPILDAKGRRSYVTSAGPAPSLGCYLLMVYLPAQHAVEGTALQVEYLGRRLPLTVLTVGRTPAFDPQDLRMKG
ncbi:GcvT family protein [Brachybacterium fresconis]|uniref:Glycine cleavage system aminomethyltransferase T/glycine/D-amino acid oxidase-like deaminating enzyme n=1 Tax=Brachybacterium fresconis TaxID=173363 RepID=A0ABS4YH21_9MICO|nr:FAD-dependent oxidoreductase [Brachybacterium fresconis]MBP2408097.1 glycine cleavage system aminomethyltransferase T/glycine/D-amino acid oxidase-like deaminating enzyme [Brachybacterium fresconis]